MWHGLRYILKRARELARDGELLDAAAARLRGAWRTRAVRAGRDAIKEYTADLPEGFAARRITLRLSVPRLPRGGHAFADHVLGADGRMTDTVLAIGKGGFAISRDLGERWERIDVASHRRHRFVQMSSLGGGEFLAAAQAPENQGTKDAPVDVLVVGEDGTVRARHPAQGFRWHGNRGFGQSGDTLMYAEYPSNRLVNRVRTADCRVLRSRDRGRTWQTVFEQNARQIRHFHFLQPRPGAAGEWWLTAGDLPHESRLWVSKDDGDTWNDLTGSFTRKVRIDRTRYDRAVFRTTDLFWLGDEVVWATDDPLAGAPVPGAVALRSRIGDALEPALIGRGKWHFRNIVDIGDHLLFIAQRSNERDPAAADVGPRIYIMPKTGASALVHLFTLDCYPLRDDPGFTYSRASRAAQRGVFFSFRSSDDVFPAGDKILKWDVSLS
jgi:hypothetical protein